MGATSIPTVRTGGRSVPVREDGGELRIVGSRCGDCGTAVFPAAPTCPGCHGEMAPADLAPTGTVYSYSTVHAGADAPYTLAYVDLDDGVRLLARLDGAVGIDDPVTVSRTDGEAIVFEGRP